MEITLSILLGFMIIGAIFALHAKDLLSALISCGIVGYGLVVCFLLLRAPDLAIVQIVVETITLIIMVAVVLDSTREELREKAQISVNGTSYIGTRYVINLFTVLIFAGLLLYFFAQAIDTLNAFGLHEARMSAAYVGEPAADTGSANLVTGVLIDFRAYDTLGEAVILYTAALGALTLLRMKGKK